MQGQPNQFDPSQLPERMASKVVVDENGCWVWTGARTPPSGYGNVSFGKRRVMSVHRASYELLIGPIPDGLIICHHCDNPPCCNPAHLFAGTQSDNLRDMVRKGRGNYVNRADMRGEKHSQAVLTEEAVRDIRARYKRHVVTGRMLANQYGVSTATVEDVLHRRTWRHVS